MTAILTRKNSLKCRQASALALAFSFSFGTNFSQPCAAGDFGKESFSKAPAPHLDLKPYSQSDAGLKLLLGILTRLGNEPQLAMKNESFKADQARSPLSGVRQTAMGQTAGNEAFRNQLGGQLAQNYTDPALAIRPQAAKRLTVGHAVINKLVPIEGIAIEEGKIAMANQVASPAACPAPSAVNLKKNTIPRMEEKARLISVEQNQNAGVSQATSIASNQLREPYLKEFARDSRRAAPSLQNAPSPYSSNSRGYVREFGYLAKKQGALSADDKAVISYGGAAATNSLATGATNGTIAQSETASAFGSGAGGGGYIQDQSLNGIIRPSEQPGLFKYVREHSKELPKDLPSQPARELVRDNARELSLASADAMKIENKAEDEEKATDSLARLDRDVRTKAKARKAEVGGKTMSAPSPKGEASAPPLLAFLPPSTVRGINGLSLGASESETLAYLQKHGPVNKTSLQGWKIWTVQDRGGQASLQVYIKGGKAEAFRVFSQEYVPLSLGVSIADDLSGMKTKFGEPSFILEEPKTTGVSVVSPAKNYVYPLSQVSFQLARAGNQRPQVLSILLFKYI